MSYLFLYYLCDNYCIHYLLSSIRMNMFISANSLVPVAIYSYLGELWLWQSRQPRLAHLEGLTHGHPSLSQRPLGIGLSPVLAGLTPGHGLLAWESTRHLVAVARRFRLVHLVAEVAWGDVAVWSACGSRHVGWHAIQVWHGLHEHVHRHRKVETSGVSAICTNVTQLVVTHKAIGVEFWPCKSSGKLYL